MTYQSSLFPDELPVAPQPQPVGNALAASALKRGPVQSSPAQKRFNQLVTQTETLVSKIEAARQAADAHRSRFANAIPPLEQARDAHMREMVLWLAGRLQKKGLTAKQREMATDMLCSLAGPLGVQGDAQMQALYDAHSPQSLADTQKDAAADMQRVMEEMLGEPLGAADTAFDSMEDLLHAARQKMLANEAQEAQDRAQRAAKKKKTSAQLKKEQLASAHAQDADGALRTLYRQLASALHPDREPDPQEQLRKTGLMKEANAAYERRDLLALLQLQLQADLADADHVASLAKEKLEALTALLKERVAVLNQELRMVQHQAMAEFDLPPYTRFSESSLKHHLLLQQQNLQADIAMMQQDLQRVQDDAYFKRWLKEQHQLSQEDIGPLDYF
ncbi:MAG: hypothetical protein HYX43_02385 [Burkholderiales bacterium]|nr:hypothetical protein [Burkholderiales bacterium]